MKIRSFTTNFSNSLGTKLFGKAYVPTDSESVASVLIIPGFTPLGTKRYKELQRYLARKSVSSFSFDYQGVGKSDGNTDKTKILELVSDTKAAISECKNKLPSNSLFILGYSLGAYILPKILSDLNNSKGVIMVSPSAYSNEVDELYLNDQTIGRIRSEFQDKNSEIFTKLANFDKNVLIIFGGEDAEIPLEIRTLFKSIKNKKIKYVTISKGVHSLLRNRSSLEKEAANELIETIYQFIRKNL